MEQRRAFTLAVGSDSGGVGKSTYVANQAAMLANKGVSVVVLKADKNPDLLGWSEKRIAAGLPEVPVMEAYGNLTKEITRLQKMCNVLIIDCPGHDSEEFRSALVNADVLLSPIKPSSDFEVETLTTVIEKVRVAQLSNKRLQPWILMTRVKANKVHKAIELDKLLSSDSAWIQPLKTRISELDVFEEACNSGAGVHDVARASSLGKAKAQIELVAKEIGIPV
jgi:chromosome partitioning protein